MIPVPSDVRVWLAVRRTGMRRGMNGRALQVQQALGRDPFVGDLFVFRGARGDLIKSLRHDGLGLSLYAKRLERGRFVSPPDLVAPCDSAARSRPQGADERPLEGRAATISAAQLAYLLSGIDWRNPLRTFRPERAELRRFLRTADVCL